MPVLHTYYPYTMVAAGGDIILPVDSAINVYQLLPNGGAITLVDNLTFSSSGTPKVGHEFRFLYGGGVTQGVFEVEFFGVTLTDAQALYKQEVSCYYNGTAWEVRITKDGSDGNEDFDGDDIVDETITTNKIADDSITLAKMANLAARGYLIRGGAAGAPEGFDAVTSGNLVMGNGTDIISQAMSGDATINGSGVIAIGAGKITTTMLAFTLADQLLEASLTIPTASVLALNATPLTIVSAPGAGKYIEVVSATSSMTFVSAAYATNTTLQLICTGADIAQVQDTAILLATVSKNTKFKDVTSATAGQTQIITNTALQVKVATGEATTGDSDLIVKVLYRIVTI